MAQRKEFTDKKVDKKIAKLTKADRKRLKQAKKETQKALDKHRLGWTTRDGKSL